MNARWRQRGVTLTELLVVGGVLIVLIAVVFSVSSYRRYVARRQASAVQMRGIHQGMVTWSLLNSATGDGPYPGFTRKREIDLRPIDWQEFKSGRTGAYPAYRYATLLNGSYFAPEFAIHPLDGFVKTPAVVGSEVTAANFSFAMLRLDTAGRKAEWLETLNPDAPVLSDRMIGTIASPQSIWTRPGEGRWAGHVVFNDYRVEWIDAAAPIVRNTRYGDGATVAADHLFVPDNADAAGNTGTNAAMVYATDRDHENQK